MITGQLQLTPVRYILTIASFAVCLICLPSELRAQRQIGIHWEVPEDINQASQQLELFSQLGLTHLEVDGALPDPVWKKIDELGFSVFGLLPIQFPVPRTFAQPDSIFLESVTSLVSHYAGHPSVEAIGLFQYGLVQDERFAEAVEPYAQQINQAYSGKLYYLTSQADSHQTRQWFDFELISVQIDISGENRQLEGFISDTSAYYYNPSEELHSYLTPVKGFLEATSGSSLPVFFNSSWLLNILDQYPDFSQTLQLYTGEEKPVFATPREQLPASHSKAPVTILLIIVWGIFAITYSFSPVFRRSLSRYFIGHRFYVDDVMKRHIRSMGPAAIMLLLHAILAGIVVYCLLTVNFSNLGIRALSTHIPISIGGGNFLISAVGGTILASLVIEGISVLWLRIINSGIKQLAQVVNLYIWPLLLNLCLATAVVTLMQAGYGPAIITILGALFFLIFYSSFLITSVDTGRFMKTKKWLVTGTNIIYLLLLLVFIIQVAYTPYLQDIFRLGLWLS